MNPHDEDQQQPSVIRQQGKKLLRQKASAVGKKAAKAVAKAAVKATIALTKFLLGWLVGLGAPVLLVIGGVSLLVLIIYIIVTMFYSNTPEVLEGDALALHNHIVAVADGTVDMSKSEQLPYRVPHELIISALQIYDSGKHGVSEKKAASMMAEILAPVFTYEQHEGSIETEVETCVDGNCSTNKTSTPFTINPLTGVEAWNTVMTATVTPYTTEWQEAQRVKKRIIKTPKLDGFGNIIPNEFDEEEEVTVITTRSRSHAFLVDTVENEDYTYFDRVLTQPPFEYGIQDKKIVEAIYETTGGFIQYSSWLTGNSLIGFDGVVIPGSGVPSEYMPIYLAAEKKYKVDWYFVAAIHYVETAFSTHPTMVSGVGAEGHTQFMSCSWVGWAYPACGGVGNANIPDSVKLNPAKIKQYGGYGVDGNGDGKADPWTVEDALFTTANYLNKSGFSKDIDHAIWNYNHSDAYVAKVKAKAMELKNAAQYMPADGSTPSLAPGTFMRPTLGQVTSLYGPRVIKGKKGSFHYGIDYANARNTPIVAMADGIVVKTNSGCPDGNRANTNCSSGWGNHVRIQHTVNGKVYEAVYAHFTKLAVGNGQTVKQGQLVGYMGMSGQVTGIHTHIELYNGPMKGYGVNNLNPALYIPL